MSFNPTQTEFMFFSSDTGNIDKLEFSFNGEITPLSTSHTHVSAIFYQNANWNEHSENMITNITKHLGILRRLKFNMNRSNMEIMYLISVPKLY